VAGVLRVDGHLTDRVDELRAAVAQVRRVLGDRRGLPATGVLVVLGTLEGVDPHSPEVLASAASALPERLALLPATLEFGEVDVLWDRVRRSTTWRA
jgi:hypothetical protein